MTNQYFYHEDGVVALNQVQFVQYIKTEVTTTHSTSIECIYEIRFNFINGEKISIQPKTEVDMELYKAKIENAFLKIN